MRDNQMEVIRNGKKLVVELELQYIPPRKPTWDCAGEPEEWRVKAYDWTRFFPKEVVLYSNEESAALDILLRDEFVMHLTQED
jgi:hypothetical protein